MAAISVIRVKTTLMVPYSRLSETIVDEK